MEWNNGMVIEFLEAYATEPTIWDLRNEEHKRKSLVHAAWQRVHSQLNWNCTIDDLKRKRDSLMAYYRIHWNKARQWKITNGSEGAQDYATTWFAFETMNKFLGEIYGIDNEELRQETRSSNNTQSIRKVSKRKYEESPETVRDSDSNDSFYEIETKPTPMFTVLEAHSIEPLESNSIEHLEPNSIERLETRQETPANKDQEDECDLYGNLLAYKLRKFKEEDRLILMNDIDNLLFRARMKALSKKPCSQDDKDPFESVRF